MINKKARLTTVEKYRRLVYDIAKRNEAFLWKEVQDQHRVSSAVGTTLRLLGYIRREPRTSRVVWVGPHPDALDYLKLADQISAYRYETRKNAPSVVTRGSRQERRERDEKWQGWRSDVQANKPVRRMPPKKTVSILWGLITWSR